jgi:hypothetical protein
VRSRWVNEEIRAFKALGREGRVFCLIVDGEPNATDVAGSELQECFPNAVRFTVGDGGRITSTRTEPLAATAVLAALAVLLIGLTSYAIREQLAAEREARAARASLSGQVATHAQSSLETFPRRSLLLAAQALRITEDRHEPTVPAASRRPRCARYCPMTR